MHHVNNEMFQLKNNRRYSKVILYIGYLIKNVETLSQKKLFLFKV